MAKRFIITESEKNKIRKMYGFINEQSSGITNNECYQITNDADKKIYKVKVIEVHSNYVIGDLTDDKGVVYQGREIGIKDNKMSTSFSIDKPATDTEIESSVDVKVSGVYQKVSC